MTPLRIIFMGTAELSCASLEKLCGEKNFSVVAVVTQPDIEALKRISGESSLPLLTLGSQQLRGLVEREWNQYLDLAGYPAVSQLPPGYRFPPATALAPPGVGGESAMSETAPQ